MGRFLTYALLHAQVVICLGLLLDVHPDSRQVLAAALGVRRQQTQDFLQLLLWQGGQHIAGDAGGDVVLIPLGFRIRSTQRQRKGGLAGF